MSACAVTYLVRDASAVAPVARPSRALVRADRAATAALVLVLLLLGTGLALRAGGIVAMVDRSDSMAPAIHAGDVLLTRGVTAGAVRPGDVVTLRDPVTTTLITHRAVRVAVRSGRATIVTRGDANHGDERWVVPASSAVRRSWVRVPLLGHVLLWLASPALRLLVALLGAGLLAAAAVRSRRAT